MKKAIPAVGLLMASVLLGTLSFHGGVWHVALSTFAALAAAVFAVSAWVSKKNRKMRRALIQTYAAAVFGSLGISYFSGIWFYEQQIATTKKRIEVIFQDLERQRG